MRSQARISHLNEKNNIERISNSSDIYEKENKCVKIVEEQVNECCFSQNNVTPAKNSKYSTSTSEVYILHEDGRNFDEKSTEKWAIIEGNEISSSNIHKNLVGKENVSPETSNEKDSFLKSLLLTKNLVSVTGHNNLIQEGKYIIASKSKTMKNTKKCSKLAKTTYIEDEAIQNEKSQSHEDLNGVKSLKRDASGFAKNQQFKTLMSNQPVHLKTSLKKGNSTTLESKQHNSNIIKANCFKQNTAKLSREYDVKNEKKIVSFDENHLQLRDSGESKNIAFSDPKKLCKFNLFAEKNDKTNENSIQSSRCNKKEMMRDNYSKKKQQNQDLGSKPFMNFRNNRLYQPASVILTDIFKKNVWLNKLSPTRKVNGRFIFCLESLTPQLISTNVCDSKYFPQPVVVLKDFKKVKNNLKIDSSINKQPSDQFISLPRVLLHDIRKFSIEQEGALTHKSNQVKQNIWREMATESPAIHSRKVKNTQKCRYNLEFPSSKQASKFEKDNRFDKKRKLLVKKVDSNTKKLKLLSDRKLPLVPRVLLHDIYKGASDVQRNETILEKIRDEHSSPVSKQVSEYKKKKNFPPRIKQLEKTVASNTIYLKKLCDRKLLLVPRVILHDIFKDAANSQTQETIADNIRNQSSSSMGKKFSELKEKKNLPNKHKFRRKPIILA
ncbi:uncharacterized protein [Parasteatoda tepidariorum]|uniref:uncharacterized protein n=1 Tax=Parasteatoda tepidariorum TaxID=114398 RepID=UPI0039BD31DF